jgi:hypothetical protein
MRRGADGCSNEIRPRRQVKRASWQNEKGVENMNHGNEVLLGHAAFAAEGKREGK